MTSRTAPSRALLAGLAVAALGLTLTACGGSESSSTSSQAAAPASSAAAPASSSAPASPSSAPSESASESASESPSPSESTGSADVKKVCDTLSAGDVSKLTGVKLKKGTSTDLGPSNICQWTPSDPGEAIFSGQEGPLPGPLSQVEGQLKKQFNGSVDKISVSGADEARYIKGKKSGVNVIDVLAAKDGVFYQVLVASPKGVTQHKDGAVKIVEALIAG